METGDAPSRGSGGEHEEERTTRNPMRREGGRGDRGRGRGSMRGRGKDGQGKSNRDEVDEKVEKLKTMFSGPEAKASPLYTPPVRFDALEISGKTLQGLQSCEFTDLMPIQRETIPRALCGYDLYGIAETGSGKTLAFAIPLVEFLYRNAWSPQFPMGALVLVPTQDLSKQVASVITDVCSFQPYSVGVVDGSNNLTKERRFITRMNIIVATPGRLLWHLDNTPEFDPSGCEFLVIDEFDRMLGPDFAGQIHEIVRTLPKKKQILLFSATKPSDKRISKLGKLLCKSDWNPVQINLTPENGDVVPPQLVKWYCPLEYKDKLDAVFTFVQEHISSKIIVFLATARQVDFFFELFKSVNLKTLLMKISGRCKAKRRTKVFTEFSSRGRAVLLTTDVSERGMDYPEVDWVLMADCPRDVDIFIHRAGRTARIGRKGSCLLFLAPPEMPFLEELKKKGIELKEKDIHISTPVGGTANDLCTKDMYIRLLAQKAVISYANACHKMNRNWSCKMTELPIQEISNSYGLELVATVKKGPQGRHIETEDLQGPGEDRHMHEGQRESRSVESYDGGWTGEGADLQDKYSDVLGDVDPWNHPKSRSERSSTRTIADNIHYGDRERENPEYQGSGDDEDDIPRRSSFGQGPRHGREFVRKDAILHRRNPAVLGYDDSNRDGRWGRRKADEDNEDDFLRPKRKPTPLPQDAGDPSVTAMREEMINKKRYGKQGVRFFNMPSASIPLDGSGDKD